jgi:hypothetical protein
VEYGAISRKPLEKTGGSETKKLMMKNPFQSVTAVAFLTLATGANALTLTCVGEPISSRAIGGGQASTSAFADSAITAKGKEDYFFTSLSSVGRQIAKVCPIRDENVSDEPGPACQVTADVVRRGRPSVNVIRRVIKIEPVK